MPVRREGTVQAWREIDGVSFAEPKNHLTVFEAVPRVALSFEILDLVRGRSGALAVREVASDPASQSALYAVTTKALNEGGEYQPDTATITGAREHLNAAILAASDPELMARFMTGADPLVVNPTTFNPSRFNRTNP